MASTVSFTSCTRTIDAPFIAAIIAAVTLPCTRCSTGAPSSPTVLGNYTITGYRMYSFGHGYTCYYATQFWGDYLFHSVPYNEGTHTIQDGRLGYSVSLGCVRLAINNAKWIYDTIPAGTFVKTYY